MGVTVTLQYGNWCAFFPELAPYIDEAAFNACFARAQLFQANDGSGPINNVQQATALMGLMTAHMAALYYPVSGPTTNPDPSSPLVGRISNATEGSVNVSAQNDYPPGSAQFYQQTKYGSAWWEATAQYRTARYLPPSFATGPYGPFGFIGRGGLFPGRRYV